MTASPPPNLILALTGLAAEPDLIRALTQPGSGFTVARRASDLVEVAGAVAGDADAVLLLSPHFPRLSLEVVSRFTAAGVGCFAVVDVGDDPGERLARQWGLRVVAIEPGEGAVEVLRRSLATTDPPTAGPRPEGRVVAVCGPQGSSGRTTLAVNLAAEVGQDSLVIDADTAAASVAFLIGVEPEPSGLLAACAQAEAGVLDVDRLRACTRRVAPGLAVCTGVSAPARTGELHASGVSRVLRIAAAAAPWTVVDCGPAVSPLFDTVAAAADQWVVAASPTAVGMRRLADWWPRVAEGMPAGTPGIVVWNGVPRRGALGPDAAARLRGFTMSLVGDRAGVAALPLDPGAAASMDRRSGTLSEVAPRSALRRGIARLAEQMAATPLAPGQPAPTQNRTPRHTGTRGSALLPH